MDKVAVSGRVKQWARLGYLIRATLPPAEPNWDFLGLVRAMEQKHLQYTEYIQSFIQGRSCRHCPGHPPHHPVCRQPLPRCKIPIPS